MSLKSKFNHESFIHGLSVAVAASYTGAFGYLATADQFGVAAGVALGAAIGNNVVNRVKMLCDEESNIQEKSL